MNETGYHSKPYSSLNPRTQAVWLIMKCGIDWRELATATIYTSRGAAESAAAALAAQHPGAHYCILESVSVVTLPTQPVQITRF